MEYKIVNKGASPALEIKLLPGQKIKAEFNALIAVTGDIDLKGNIEGGVIKGMTRLLAREKLFFQYIEAREESTVLLGPQNLGEEIAAIHLDGSYKLNVQKDGFLASTEGIEISTGVQNLMQGIFSGEGLFIIEIGGRGTVFVNSFGGIYPIKLKEGEKCLIDNYHLVAWRNDMKYKITKAADGWISSITSGEILVCQFEGPGIVLVQTRNPKRLTKWVNKQINKSKAMTDRGQNNGENNGEGGNSITVGNVRDKIINYVKDEII